MDFSPELGVNSRYWRRGKAFLQFYLGPPVILSLFFLALGPPIFFIPVVLARIASSYGGAMQEIVRSNQGSYPMDHLTLGMGASLHLVIFPLNFNIRHVNGNFIHDSSTRGTERGIFVASCVRP